MSSRDNERSEQAGNVLADDHFEIDTLIRELLSALDEGDKPKAFARLDLLWAKLAVHIRAEHLCLFPSILQAHFSTPSSGLQYHEAQSTIDQLRLDHEFFMRVLGKSVNAFRMQENASNPEGHSQLLREVRRSITQMQNRLVKHNRFEENHVYKWIDVLLGEAERSALVDLIRRQLENTPPRFNSESELS